MEWPEYFLNIAGRVADKSKDPSTKVGCVIVGPDNEIRSTGYNGFARGVDETLLTRWERPEKYNWVEHAERNAIYNAARSGTSLRGCVAYLWCPPCIECAKAIIQSGIKEIVVKHTTLFTDRDDWQENIHFAKDMLAEAGVKFTLVHIE